MPKDTLRHTVLLEETFPIHFPNNVESLDRFRHPVVDSFFRGTVLLSFNSGVPANGLPIAGDLFQNGEIQHGFQSIDLRHHETFDLLDPLEIIRKSFLGGDRTYGAKIANRRGIGAGNNGVIL